MFLIVSLLVLFLETRADGTEKASTSVADAVEELSRPELEILMTTTEGTITSVVDTGGESSQPDSL